MGKNITDTIRLVVSSIIIDILAVGIVYFMPEIVKTTQQPVFLIDPMRILVLAALAHTGRYNALLLAVGLPLFSYFFGGHPHMVKSGLIAIELVSNILLFYLFLRSMPVFGAMVFAIVLSKCLYYGLKWIAIQTLMPDATLIATPLWIQGIVTVVLSGYVYLYLKSKK